MIKYLFIFFICFSVILLKNGQVYTFGSNVHGQLGAGDLLTHAGLVHVKLPIAASHVAAGSNHTVILTVNGEVYTFGVYQVYIFL